MTEIKEMKDKYPYLYATSVDIATQMAKSLTAGELWQARALAEIFMKLIDKIID